MSKDIFSRPAIHVLTIALLGLMVYSNTFHVPFILDDHPSIVENPVIKNLDNFFTGRAGYDYNPRRFIGYLTIALNYRLGGLDVTGYHLFNLAVHIITACLVYALVRLTLRTPFFKNAECGMRGDELIAHNLLPLFAALLFVSHPVQTQAVTYIVQRLASLAAMFFLASLVLYIRARLSREAGKRGVTAVWYSFSLASAVLAMKTKELAVTLPAVVFLYEFFFFKGKTVRRLTFLLPMLLTVAIVPLSMVEGGKPAGEFLSDLSDKARADTAMARSDYLVTQFRVIVTYLRLLVLPVNQNLDYDYPLYTSFLQPEVFMSFLFLLSLFGLAVYLFYRSMFNVQCSTFGIQNYSSSPLTPHSSRLIAFGILWFFVTLSVESSFVPIADVIFEHRLYLPSAGVFIAVAACLAYLSGRFPARAIVVTAVLAVAFLSAAAWKRNLVWGDDVGIWRNCVAKSPEKARPRLNLAKALSGKGELDEAADHYKTVLRLKPDFDKAHNNLGALYKKVGRFEEALQEYRAAITIDPSFAEAYNNLGLLYVAQGRMDEAFKEFQTAVRLKPDYAEAHNNLGMVYKKYGRIEEAAREFRMAVRLDPGHALAARNLQSLSR